MLVIFLVTEAIIISGIVFVDAYVQPTVNLTSCLSTTATISIGGTQTGGLVYIRTDQAYNIVPTTGGDMVYTCSFEDCNINWDERFTVVVQEKVSIQTNNDVLIWFVCNADMASILPMFFDLSGSDSDNLTTITYKAEVVMQFYDDVGSEILSGTTVKLGAQVDVTINITNNFNDFFDINVKSCSAAGIPLIEERCSVDDDLFVLFSKVSTGLLGSNFSVFRPTTLTGGASMVIFSCTLEVCKYACDEYVCNEGNATRVSTRKKRDTVEDDGPSTKYIGAILNVVTEADDTDEEIVTTNTLFCINNRLFFTIIVGLVILLASSTTVAVFYITEYCKHQHNCLRSKRKASRTAPNQAIETATTTKSNLNNKHSARTGIKDRRHSDDDIVDSHGKRTDNDIATVKLDSMSSVVLSRMQRSSNGLKLNLQRGKVHQYLSVANMSPSTPATPFEINPVELCSIITKQPPLKPSFIYR